MNYRRPYQEPTVPPMMHAKRNRAKVSLIFHDFFSRLMRARTCTQQTWSRRRAKRRAAGETLAAIAKSYGVDISMISRLR